MSKLVDRTGEKYGHLTALHRASDKIYSSGRKVAMWTCLCECGNEIDVCTNSLRTGPLGLAVVGTTNKERVVKQNLKNTAKAILGYMNVGTR